MTVDKDLGVSEGVIERAVDIDQWPPRGKLAAVGGRMGWETETDTESGGSSTEEGESPRSVAMRRRRKATAPGCLHSQVLRVMEEDLHLGEDIIAASAVNGGGGSRGDRQIVILSRPILLCSPLSGKGVKAAELNKMNRQGRLQKM